MILSIVEARTNLEWGPRRECGRTIQGESAQSEVEITVLEEKKAC